MSLGQRIKEQRKIAGLSQEKVAELVGVSRQAVTKWETGQSAPSTENLFKLAEIFGTRVDMLLASDDTDQTASAERIYALYKMEEKKKASERRARGKRNFLLALAAVGGYAAIYLAGRFFAMTGEQTSIMGRLFGGDPTQFHYLYGWLLQRKLFWAAMAVSAVPALFGKKFFSVTTLFGFAIALLLGELCGQNPAGAAYGHGHYGWAIWGCIFGFCVVMGVILEKMAKGKLTRRSKEIWLWLAVFVTGILVIVLVIRASMPRGFG